MTHSNPWDAPVYKGNPEPKECSVCHKKGKHLRSIADGLIECSHVECPIRQRQTARPTDKPDEQE